MIGSATQLSQAKLVVATRRSASAILLILCTSLGCASSTLGKSLNVGVAVSKFADFHSTNVAEARGGREANPFVGTGDLRQAFVSVVGVSGVIGSAALLDRKDRRITAQIIRATAIVVWSAISVRNYQIGR